MPRLISCENSATGTVQLDMLSPTPRRGLQIICENALYTHDLIKGTLTRTEKNKTEENISAIDNDYSPPSMLKDAMTHFLKRIETSSLPASCSLEEAVHDLKILCAAQNSAKNHRKEKVAS